MVGKNKFECLVCGCRAPLPIIEEEDDDDEHYKVTRLDRAKDVRTIEVDSYLCPGGRVVERGLLLVGGIAGAGKSTLTAGLALAFMKYQEERAATNYEIAWLDCEQSAAEVRVCFERVGATVADRRCVKRYRCPTLDSLIAALADGDEPFVVVDSLHALTDLDAEVREIVDCCWERGKRSLVVMIAHSSKQNDVRGTTYAKHKTRANLWVEPDHVRVEKCRWSPVRQIPRPPVSRETKPDTSEKPARKLGRKSGVK